MNKLLKIAENTREIGANILLSLHKQDNQLKRINNELHEIDNNNNRSSNLLSYMERGFISMLFWKKPRKSPLNVKDVEQTDYNQFIKLNSVKNNKVKQVKEKNQLSHNDNYNSCGSSSLHLHSQVNQDQIQQQEEQLDILGDIVTDLKLQANTINHVLENQNEMIDVISENVEMSNYKIKKSNRRIRDL